MSTAVETGNPSLDKLPESIDHLASTQTKETI
jgi:hypothetical protein